MKIRNTRTT